MNKGDLTNFVADHAGLTKVQAGAAIDAVLDGIKDALTKNDKAAFVGFGTFSVSKRAARTGKNPATGKEIKIPAMKVVKFKPGQGLKDAVN
ncbi:MAG: HU family DNA-binding protein [Deltaproteobacteria bacterium]